MAMHHRPLAAAVVLAAVAVAQQPSDPQALEAALRARAVAAFNAQADALEAQQQWGSALALRFELLGEYDGDDAHARDKCGFVKVGDGWRRDAARLVLETDGKGDKRALKKLEQQWQKEQKELAKAHEELAKAWAAVGEPSRAARHLQRLLRLRPGDQQLVAQLQLTDFEGFLGSAHDLDMLRHSRQIRCAASYLKAHDFPVESLGDQQLDLLQRAKLTHRGVRSRHFTVWGSLPEAQLVLAAQYAERSLLLTRALFGVRDGAIAAPRLLRDMIFVPDQPSYTAVLDACAGQFDAGRRQFLEQQVALFYPAVGERTLRCYKILNGEPVVLDQAVRGVVQDALPIATDGIWEGIGHAFCGFFFDQTLTFMVEQQQAHTVTAWRPTPLVPDMKVWREIASATAWSKADAPSAQLVLLQAARFTNEQRVKAWSMVDWLCRWRPELVLDLDHSRIDQPQAQPEIEAEFRRRTGLDLADLDRQWRDFWSKDAALRQAIATDPKGKKDEIAAAAALGTAIDDARLAAGLGPLGWHVVESPLTTAAQRWLTAVQKAEAEARQNPKRAVELPAQPPELEHRVLCHAGSDAAAAVAAWLQNPAWRDALLHPGRMLIGCNQQKHGVVVDLTDPITPIDKGMPLQYPAADGVSLPRSVDMAELGARAAGVLAAHGKQPTDRVGYPLTLHFFRPLAPIDSAQIACRVLDGVHALEGIVVPLHGDDVLHGDAVGCFAFVAFEPLPAATGLEVQWTLPARKGNDDAQLPAVTFRTAAK